MYTFISTANMMKLHVWLVTMTASFSSITVVACSNSWTRASREETAQTISYRQSSNHPQPQQPSLTGALRVRNKI